jgi:hypothetical protein
MPKDLHTDYELRWRNYRAFADTDWVVLKPLTVLVGANNGGKSSVLSPLLLMAQTLASSDREVPLLPFGPLIDLGNYRDFVHDHDISRQLVLSLRFHIHAHRAKLKPIGAYPPGGIELTFSPGSSPEQILLKNVSVTDIYDRSYFSRTAKPKGGFSFEGAVALGAMKAAEKKALEAARPMNFLFSPNDVFYELNREAPKDEQHSDPASFSKAFSHYLRALSYTYSFVRSIFYQLSYIGPLRAKLCRYYRVSPEIPDTVGAQGEHAANLFRRSWEKIKPRVDSWVKRFEFGDELRFKSLTDDLFQLVFRSGTEETNVADAGFGASQVLPLLIQAAAAPENSLTIAEQPEIHLNPRLQCVLADLFVEMATSGHRILVETHSEHLIVRLRRLVAEKKIAASDVSLLFVEKNSAGASSIRRIPIEENGNVNRDSWPTGFFEDALREALALAAVQTIPRRRAQKKTGGK